jgi:tetratricopeptide (TPR) repeat protein
MKEYPDYSPTYNDLAEIRFQQGRLEEAVHYIERGLEIAPNDAVLLNNAGVCSLIKHDYQAALDYFKRASQIAPYESRYRANVALAMGLTGDLEGSRALYGQVVSAEAADHNAQLIQSLVAPPAPQEVAEETTPLSFADFALLAPQETVPDRQPIAEPAPIVAPEVPAAPETFSAPQPVTTGETIASQETTTDEEITAEQEPLAPNN